MKDVFDAIVFYDNLNEVQRTQLRDALKEDSELARSFKRWRKLQQAVHSSINAHVPDRSFLVLYALSQSAPDFLTSAEREQVERESEALGRALRAHPALNQVVRQIQEAGADFQSLWEDLVSSNEPQSQTIAFDQTANRSSGITGNNGADKAADRASSPPQRNGQRWKNRPFIRRFSSIFIVLALVATASVLIWRSQNLEIIKTSPGEFRVVELTDGSTIRLFGKSKISYSSRDDRFSNERAIQLKGRAFFDVAPSSSPFVVRTATALTEATGTRFSIEADRSHTKVILTSGQVAISSRQRRGENVLLSPGEMSLIPRREQPSTPQTMGDLTDVLSWTGLLVFHDTPLSEVAAHLSEYYQVTVTIDPALIDEQWVATYDPDTLSVDEILDNLAATLGAVVEATDEDAYRLSR